MKTYALIAAIALAPLALSHGQAAAVYDQAVNGSVGQAVDQLKLANTALGTLLNKADQQLQALQNSASDLAAVKQAAQETTQAIKDLAGVIGDPNKVKPGGFDQVRDKINDWKNDGKLPDPPKYDKDLETPHSQDDGKQAFDKATADGLFKSIGSTYKPDPSKDDTQPRDPKLYTGQVNTLASVTDYFKVREASLKRREDLQNLLRDALDEVKKAKDFATLEKQNALVSAIESQLKTINDDINSSFNDVAVRAVQMFTMGQIKQTADNEAMGKVMDDKLKGLVDGIKNGPPAGAGGTTPTGGYTSGLLPWKHYSR